jgi:DNA-binding transcriptional LysR family regulator
MNITFRQLRLFLALAEKGSVSAAAKAMHITQPTASMQLKQIAQVVGVPTHEGDGRGVRLTEAGHHLASTARVMFGAWEEFEQQLAASRGLKVGRLRIAVVSTAKYFMPKIVGSFCRLHPQVEVSLEILNRDGVVQRLRDGMDDLYIMSMPPPDMALDDEVILPNPIVVIASNSDELCRARNLTLRDLQGRSLVLREKGSGTRMAADRHFRRQRFRPDVRLELGSNEAIKQMVSAGLGLGVVSRHSLQGSSTALKIQEIEIKGFPIPSAWHLVRPSTRRLSPVAQAFREHLLDAMKSKKN